MAIDFGYDASGRGNNWTANNLSSTAGAGNDSLVDTPTSYGTDTGAGGEVRGNYCTMNPLDSKNGTASNGNLLWTATASQSDIRGTFAIPASGKWYIECTVGSTTNASSAVSFGLATSSVALDASNAVTGLYQLYASSSGFLSLNGTNVSSSLGTWTAGDVLQIAVDVDNTKMWLGKNNTWYNSSGGTTGDPSTGANATSTTSMVGLFPFSNCYQNNATWNAGQRAFSYTAPSGFKALCTQNLPTPTISNGATVMAATTYTGNGSTQSVSNSNNGVSFQPDMVWIKTRSTTSYHQLVDSVRGVSKVLNPNYTGAESTYTGFSVTAFNSNGFTVVDDAAASYGVNGSTGSPTYVGWQWKANGAGVTNTSGTITSTVSANTTAGFSIVTFTGTGAAGTIGHGLGVAPSMVIVKSRSATGDWWVYHKSLGNTGVIWLELTNAYVTGDYWNNTSPTSSVFSIKVAGGLNATGVTQVAYCFAEVAGYSAFGSYTGNGSADGPFVFCGFKPAFVMFKRTDSTENWLITDYARNTYNVVTNRLYPNLSAAEDTGTPVDFLSNGFKIRAGAATPNISSGSYIYAAFAESPFKYSLAR